MSIVFDLGSVVITWRPREIIANVFADPAVRTVVLQESIEHVDWLALDRGALSLEHAIVRASTRTALAESDIANFLNRVHRR